MTAPVPTGPTGPWPENGLEQVGHCPACGERERSVLHSNLWDNSFFVAPGRWDMWRCARCRSGYLDPRPTPDTIALAYGRYYTHDAPEPFVEPVTPVQKFRAALGNDYRNSRYGTRAALTNRLGRIVLRLYRPLGRVNDFRFRFLDQPRVEGGSRRVLDVGCGAGAFLAQAREAGWEATGVDFDPAAVEGARARGLDVLLGGVEAVADRRDHFDAITLSHVIEHVHDPVGVLRTLHAIMKPGGRLYLETPNVNALGHQLFGPNWRGLEAPRHLVIFNRKSLRSALERAGFRNVRFRRDPTAFKWLAMRSAKIAAGLDPNGDDPNDQFWPSRKSQLKGALAQDSVEFLAFTCEK